MNFINLLAQQPDNYTTTDISINPSIILIIGFVVLFIAIIFIAIKSSNIKDNNENNKKENNNNQDKKTD